MGIGVGERYGDWGFPEFWAAGLESVENRCERVRKAGWEEPFTSQLLQIAQEAGESFLWAPHAMADSEQFADGGSAGLFWAWGSYVNHSVQDYGKLMTHGIEGILGEINEALTRHAYSAEDPLCGVRQTTLQGFREVAEAAGTLGLRYAHEARRLASETQDPAEIQRLTEIAEACEQVPLKPARTFREAVQSLWFGHLMTCLEDHVNANSLGRIDQWLQPFYDRDLAAGRLTEAEALEIIEAFWLKLYRVYDVQQATIGGQHPDGSDASNAVSHLCLEATKALDIIRCLSVRYHSGTPDKLFRDAMALVSRGGGVPFLFNDEAIVPALVSRGIPLEAARQYAIIGCVEIVIPGQSCPHAVSIWINLAKCLELALHGGKDPVSGRPLGPSGKIFEEMSSVEELYEAFKAQMQWAHRKAMACANAGELAQERHLPMPFHSLLTLDCIASGMDVTAGGARYNYHSACGIGIPNVGDGLAAVEKLVFDEKKISPSELMAGLACQFEEHEALRQLLKNVPKYGNDEDLPDRWASRVSEDFCEDLKTIRTLRGGCVFAHLFSFTSHLSFGAQTGALPDGRRAFEPLAYSLSPQQGNDEEGLTALLNTLAKIPHHLAAGSSSIIIESDPKLMQGEQFEKTLSLIRAGLKMGIGQLQINVVTADTLRKAQEHPEEHKNLAVRVSGFSQRFVTLSKDMQDHIIARTKHDR